MHLNKKIARVFPRKTTMTPDDDMVFFGPPPVLILPEIDEVHVSVAFTYDRGKAEDLAEDWSVLGVPVKIGGPAYNDPAEEPFVPGRYVKKGAVFSPAAAVTTSAGSAAPGGGRENSGNFRYRMGGMFWTTICCSVPKDMFVRCLRC